jgi:uncharacterized oligopeptide transporter (OPT) family protein
MVRQNGKVKVFFEEYRVLEAPEKHPSLFEPASLIFGMLQGLVGAIIGLELLTRVGITPNTAVIGAILALAVSRLPLAVCSRFRSLDRQNLMQTVISSATFGGANAILLPMGVLWLLGRRELVPAMFIGATLGMLIGAFLLYGVFDSRIYPASGIWPPGVATAECLIAGDKGGTRAILLSIGGAVGGLGRYLGIPMDIFGTCWIGNMWALTMFGVGLLISGYSSVLTGIDLQRLYLPHGIMIGAGAVAMFQMIHIVRHQGDKTDVVASLTTTDREFARALGAGSIALVLAAAALAALAGLYIEMSLGMLTAFVMFAAFAALVSQLIVGISAMHAGWFPAFAAALIFLVLGMLIGFPPLALAFLVGFTASTGPAFADMGYDLKTGWIVRGRGRFYEYEKEGRKQQLGAALLGFAVAAALVFFSYQRYFGQQLLPPVDSVFAATIQAGTGAGAAKYLLAWAVPGAMIQLIGGPSRQTGILLATGLLINNSIAGWTALVSLGTRALLVKRYGRPIESPMYVLAGGFIAGAALTGFATATLRLGLKRD